MAGLEGALGQLRDDYLRHLARMDRPAKSIAAYGHIVSEFVRFVGDRELTRALIFEWQDAVTKLELKASTRHVRYSIIRGFLRWGAAQEQLSPVLWLNVDKIKVPGRKPRPIPHLDLLPIGQYLNALVVELEQRGTKMQLLRALRTRALFHFLFASSARISEALQVNHADYRDGTVTVIQKGNREKVLITTQACQAAVAAYLAARTDDNPALFLSYPANQPPRRLSAPGANGIWLRLAGEVGIRGFTNHRVRHTTATEMGEADVADSVVQAHLGHASPQTTAGYRSILVRRRREALENSLGAILPPPDAPSARTYRPPRRQRGRPRR